MGRSTTSKKRACRQDAGGPRAVPRPGKKCNDGGPGVGGDGGVRMGLGAYVAPMELNLFRDGFYNQVVPTELRVRLIEPRHDAGRTSAWTEPPYGAFTGNARDR
jgi:hypothetical protein